MDQKVPPYPQSQPPYPAAGQPYPQSYPPPYPPPESAPPYSNQTQGYAPPSSYQYGQPSAAPPSYSTATTNTTTVAIINVPEEQYDPKGDGDMFSFDDKTVRLGFIRKVYAILALQMAVTIGLSCLFMFHEPTKHFVQTNIGVYIAAYVLFFVLYIVLVCCTTVARSYPCNVILLSVFTLSLSYLVAAITSFHDTKIVIMAFGITLICCTVVMLFACQTKYDFTTCGGVLCMLTLSLILFGLFAGIFVPTNQIRIVNMVYAGLGALLFMAFLAFDTQLIMGGRKYEISPEDYIFAAMMLYVDIIYIFLFILSLIGGKN